ncbi:MAG: rhomboid family intramembrane serine protease [Bacteroidetes bacterium]|nr:rhomboid family intramembrane serine protease [Bacteroidota bacterium]
MSITNIIVVITALISIAAFYHRDTMIRLLFNPYMVSERGQWYRFITSGFVHANWIHLLINMLVFWSFGSVVEHYYNALFEEKGPWYFILLYLGGIIIAITPTYKKHMHNAGYNSLGASGAVSAVLFAAILFRPMEKVYLYGIIGLPGIFIGVAYLMYSYYMDKKGGDFVNHDAHFWGAVFGVLFTVMLKPSVFLHFLDQLTSF